MGIYDREYYRRDGPGFLSFGSGQVVKYLILFNVLGFLIQILTLPAAGRGHGAFTTALWLTPDQVLHGQVWRLLTYAFLHDGIWHIFWNMLFLWWFGRELEDLYGSLEFLTFYLTAALVGGVVYVLGAFGPGDQQAACLGASGAVTAVLVLFACHFPTRTILIWFVLPVPIWAFVVFQVAQDTYQFFSREQTVVAVSVHLGGAVFGFLYNKLQWRLTRISSGLTKWLRQRSRPRLKVYREEPPQPVSVTAAPSGGPSELDEHLEAKLDAVLEKVARSGQASLTEGERQILVRASEVYKRRRS